MTSWLSRSGFGLAPTRAIVRVSVRMRRISLSVVGSAMRPV